MVYVVGKYKSMEGFWVGRFSRLSVDIEFIVLFFCFVVYRCGLIVGLGVFRVGGCLLVGVRVLCIFVYI